mmetsp:Transcript_47991/g.114065  ORF Transcript_47991/g.114065 Transcript_47991/m.114065 type:complete len:227 (-) Transcript_47991:94-774(-)
MADLQPRVALAIPARQEESGSQLQSPSLRSTGGEIDDWILVQTPACGWSTPSSEEQSSRRARLGKNAVDHLYPQEANSSVPRVQSSSGSEVFSLGAGASVESRQVDSLVEDFAADPPEHENTTWYPVDSMELDAVLAAQLGSPNPALWMQFAGQPALAERGADRLVPADMKKAESTCSSSHSKAPSMKEAKVVCMTLSSFLGEDVPKFPFEKPGVGRPPLVIAARG